MKMKVLVRSLSAGLGLACGRLIVDVVLEPKPARTVAVFAAIAFGVGFLVSLPCYAIYAKFRSPPDS